MRRIRIQLSAHQRRELLSLIKRTKDAKLRVRAHSVLLYDQGLGCNKIAEQLACVPSTAVNAANRFLEEGIKGLYDKRSLNGSIKVTKAYRRNLRKLLLKSPQSFRFRRPTWTRELLQKVMIEKGFVRVSLRTLSRALKALGAKWKTARPVVNCPWPEEEKEERLRFLRKLQQEAPTSEVVLYEDEVDIHLNPKIGRDWSLSGTQREVVTPGQNRKKYLAGAYEPNSKELCWVSGDRKNSELFIALLDWLLECYPRKKRIHLILDNYGIHYSKMTRQWLEDKGERISLHFLPPYSPTENRIERYWVNLHGNVTRNHRCRTIEKLMDEVEAWLASEEKHPRLKK